MQEQGVNVETKTPISTVLIVLMNSSGYDLIPSPDEKAHVKVVTFPKSLGLERYQRQIPDAGNFCFQLQTKSASG